MKQNILSAKDLGLTIRNGRKAQGLTQEALAGMSGVGARFISDLENGKDTVQIGKVLLLMGVLGLAMYTLHKWENS